MNRLEPALAGVMGWPVAHSLSPRIHHFWLHQAGLHGHYAALPVRPEQLEQALTALPALGFRGVNVTLPHKEQVFHLLDRVDPLAKRVAAVNTVIVDHKGGLWGRNTDVAGFADHLRRSAPAWRPDQGTAVILGAGGVARAVAVALQDLGVARLTIVNRNFARAEGLADALGSKNVEVVGWADRSSLLKQAGLLVNCTSLGMTGQPPLDMPLSLMPPGGVVFDTVYTPLKTTLLQQAAVQGLFCVDGLGMLIAQAAPAFQAFFHTGPPDIQAVRPSLEAVLA